MARENMTRISIDLTRAQRAAVEAMIQRYNTEVGKVLGIPVRISQREFFHILLKQHADETEQTWPEA